MTLLGTSPSRRGILSRRRQFGVPAPEVDLRRGWFLLRSALSDRGGQLDHELDIKIVRGLLRGLSFFALVAALAGL